MAESMKKGYEHRFVDSPPDELLCLICMLTARDPQQSTCCGKVYCKTCVEELRKHSNSCPQCRGDMNCFPDKRGERNIKSLKIMCDNFTRSCEWIGELGALEIHLTDCDFALLPCPNECTSNNESDDIFHVLRKDMEWHVNEECPRREYDCPHCFESGEHQDMTTTHLEECEYIEVPCPNEGCDEQPERRCISTHRSYCEFEVVNCRYLCLGCKVECLRKDLKQHENDSQYHLQCAIDTVCEHKMRVRDIETTIGKQQEMIKQQENVLAHLQSYIFSQSNEISQLGSKLERMSDSRSMSEDSCGEDHVQQVFKFTDFTKRKNYSTIVDSPPFYSSPGGYKMCFRVYADGHGDGKGSHLSVYAYLMRGDNDDQLSWPFTGKVVIELLNQLKDKNHLSYKLPFKEHYEASQRVVSGDKANKGRCKVQLVRHSSLGYNIANNCQYLKDDCLYISDLKSSLHPLVNLGFLLLMSSKL